MTTIEAQIENAFAGWLRSQGWTVETQIDYADVVASRNGEHIIAEVKGRTSSPDTDLDTAYGQLLRRMTPGSTTTRYAIVAPELSHAAVLRVPQHVRDRLQVDIYLVDVDGESPTRLNAGHTSRIPRRQESIASRHPHLPGPGFRPEAPLVSGAVWAAAWIDFPSFDG